MTYLRDHNVGLGRHHDHVGGEVLTIATGELAVLGDEHICHLEELDQLRRKTQRLDTRPALDVDRLHVRFRNEAEKLQHVGGQEKQEAGSGTVGHDHVRKLEGRSLTTSGSAEKDIEDVTHTLNNGDRSRAPALMDMASAIEGSYVERATVHATALEGITDTVLKGEDLFEAQYVVSTHSPSSVTDVFELNAAHEHSQHLISMTARTADEQEDTKGTADVFVVVDKKAALDTAASEDQNTVAELRRR